MHSAHHNCVVPSICCKRSVDVVVVDTARAAGVALGASRTDAESTHLLCRHVDETTSDFTSRVLRRIERIQRTRRVGSLWYVGGTEAAHGRSPVPLLQALLPRLEGGARLTVLGPSHCEGAVFEWLGALLERSPSSVTVRAQLYVDGAPDDGGGARQEEQAALHEAPAHRAGSTLAPPAWLAADGSATLGGDHDVRTS